MTAQSEAEKLVVLSDEQQEAWIFTVLAVNESDANRSAFLAGYNGYECPKPATARKLAWHHRGQIVNRHLVDTTP